MSRLEINNSTIQPPKLELLKDDVAGARQATIGHRVFRAIKHAIVRGQLAPGHPVSEAELARQLGVSRQPVREAFIKLSDMGLVEIRPQRGTFVQLISRREVENARFIREAIEVAVTRKAAQVADRRSVAELQALLEQQDRAGDHPDQSLFLELDDQLHRTIAVIADCAHAWRVVEDLKVQMDRVRFLSISEATPVDTIVAQHRDIVTAIAHNDPDAAEHAVHRHLREILNSLPVIAATNADVFAP